MKKEEKREFSTRSKKGIIILFMMLLSASSFVLMRVAVKYLLNTAPTLNIKLWVYLLAGITIVAVFIITLLQRIFGFSFLGSKLAVKAQSSMDLKKLNESNKGE